MVNSDLFATTGSFRRWRSIINIHSQTSTNLLIICLSQQYSPLHIFSRDITKSSAIRKQKRRLRIIYQIFEILRRNNLKIRAAKTDFLSRIKFCGAILENGFRFLNHDKTRAVREFCQPQNKKEASRVLGLLNYHRAFIPHFPSFKRSVWKIENPNAGEFAIETDASEIGIGAVLLYRDSEDFDFKPAALLSDKFNEAQKNYNINKKELLARKKAMKKWSFFLLGRQFTWFIDNSCVNWAHRIMSRKLKIAKWLAEISDFDFRTFH